MKTKEILIIIGLIIILLIFGYVLIGNKPTMNTPEPLPNVMATPVSDSPTEGCHYANGQPVACAKVEKEI